MGFLSEALSNPGTTILPAFAEEVILATLAGRTMSLRSISPSSTVDICARLQEIKDCLQKRMQIIAKHLPVTTAVVEPSLGFTHILACSIMISLNELAEGMAAAMNEYQKTMPNCLEQAFEACSEIERLARSSVRHGRFKVLTSRPLHRRGEKLTGVQRLTYLYPHCSQGQSNFSRTIAHICSTMGWMSSCPSCRVSAVSTDRLRSSSMSWEAWWGNEEDVGHLIV